MTDFHMTPRNAPSAKTRLSSDAGGRNTLRAYRSSPEDVTVQIRWGKGYATVSLSYEEAKRFAHMISEAAEELPESEKTTAA
jgi:hypothetical protein